MKYRRAVVEETIDAIEYGYERPALDVLAAIKKVDAAWKNVTNTTIRNCFRKAGFQKHDDANEIQIIEENDFLNLQSKWQKTEVFKAIDFNAFMFIDSNLMSRGTASDEQILDAVTRVEDKEEEDDADCEENGSGTVPKLTCKQASEWVENLRLFFLQSNLDTSSFQKKLDDCSDFIERESQASAKQTSITQYFN
jgi:hypothetical protein